MALISSKGIYGLTAMVELYKHNPLKPMQVKEISENTAISQRYLEQLLNKLRKANLVQSIRGAKGGYLLAADPHEILVKDILIALEDGIKIVESKNQVPPLNVFFQETKQKIEKIFEINLAELEEFQNRSSEYLHYHI